MLRVILCIILLSACAHRQEKPNDISQNRDLASVVGAHYAAIEFNKGDSSLSDTSKKNLNELAAIVDREGREIQEIKVVAWADQEYPTRAQKKASTREILLAKDRARAIRDYLKDDLHSLEKIDTFNMAKRPGKLGQIVKTEDSTVKNAFEKMGPTATTLDDGSVSYSKASKAMVIIDYADN